MEPVLRRRDKGPALAAESASMQTVLREGRNLRSGAEQTLSKATGTPQEIKGGSGTAEMSRQVCSRGFPRNPPCCCRGFVCGIQCSGAGRWAAGTVLEPDSPSSQPMLPSISYLTQGKQPGLPVPQPPHLVRLWKMLAHSCSSAYRHPFP